MVDRYTAFCCQNNYAAVRHRREIRKFNLDRVLQLIDTMGRTLGFPEFAPSRLVVFCENFMQGWPTDPAPYSNLYEKIVKDVSIQIPGEETDLLSEKAKRYSLYIAGTAFEVIPEVTDAFPLNCGFIIGPTGEVIYKRHKYQSYLARLSPDVVSPHDFYERYIEVMDGKYGRKKGDILSCFFPVIDTDIGKLGSIICNEGYFPETSRALAIQGCEIMLRSSGAIEPESSPPQELWETGNRAHALFNLAYLVACGAGWHSGSLIPNQMSRGYSMIVDYHGAILGLASQPGEAITGAVIDVESLRRRRTEPKHNWISQLRTEVFQKIYERPIYPKNLFLGKTPAPSDIEDRRAAQPIKRFLDGGIWPPPSI